MEEAELESLEVALDLAKVGQARSPIVLHALVFEGRVHSGGTSIQGQQLKFAGRCGARSAPLGATHPGPPQHGGAGQEGQRGLPGL